MTRNAYVCIKGFYVSNSYIEDDYTEDYTVDEIKKGDILYIETKTKNTVILRDTGRVIEIEKEWLNHFKKL